MTQRSRISHSLAIKSSELAMAVPQVIVHRLSRMAMAGDTPSAFDQKEFQLMSSEKITAFASSWNAMGFQAWMNYQALTISMTRTYFSLWFGLRPDIHHATRQWQFGNMKLLEKGLAPVHRTAMANAKRLGKINIR